MELEKSHLVLTGQVLLLCQAPFHMSMIRPLYRCQIYVAPQFPLEFNVLVLRIDVLIVISITGGPPLSAGMDFD